MIIKPLSAGGRICTMFAPMAAARSRIVLLTLSSPAPYPIPDFRLHFPERRAELHRLIVRWQCQKNLLRRDARGSFLFLRGSE
jgi:hypothetical protein